MLHFSSSLGNLSGPANLLLPDTFDKTWIQQNVEKQLFEQGRVYFCGYNFNVHLIKLEIFHPSRHFKCNTMNWSALKHLSKEVSVPLWFRDALRSWGFWQSWLNFWCQIFEPRKGVLLRCLLEKFESNYFIGPFFSQTLLKKKEIGETSMILSLLTFIIKIFYFFSWFKI